MNEPISEYLVSHGKTGGVGRFAAEEPMALARGDRVVVHSLRGVEIGAVLCPATRGHRRMLPPVVGKLLRRLADRDLQTLHELGEAGQRLFDDARRLSKEKHLAIEILDVDMMLEGRQAILQYLLAGTCELDAFIHELQTRHEVELSLENLAVPVEPEAEQHGGCGEENCGRKDGGGCTTCSTGGGCSSCGSGKVDIAPYFAHLRTKMEEKQRVPLL